MGKVSRKRHSAEIKARVALEALPGEQTLVEIGAKHGVHLTMVAAWKKGSDSLSVQFGAERHAGATRRARRRSRRARPYICRLTSLSLVI